MARTVAGSTPGRTNRKFLVVAVLFGALTAVLFYALTSRGNENAGARTSTTGGDTQVVVAKAPIRQRTAITADMLEVRSVSSSTRLTDAFTDVNGAVGKVTKYPIEANQQVSAGAVVDISGTASDAALALVVPTGRRAMSIEATQVLTAGGLILPGDYVDIVWVCCKNKAVLSKTLLRNVQVGAVAQGVIGAGPVGDKPARTANGALASTPSAGSGSGASSSSDNPAAAEFGKPAPEAVTITLLLTPDEAQQLFLAEQTGSLRADLRNFGDLDTPDTGITPLTQILPPDLVRGLLPDALLPEGYKP